MPIGDEASALGLPLVPDTGEEGRVRWGAREINRTRDMVAWVRSLIPISKSDFRTYSGITRGTAVPDNAVGDDGDIYHRIV